jgi:hypothetical protein
VIPKRRGRRIFIVKGASPETQPDFWPLDEVWADDFTCLGSVNLAGEFIPNPQYGKVVN